MRSHRSNEIAELHQQPSIEVKSTKKDASLIDIPATDHQPMSLIPSRKEEKPKFILICNQGELFMKSKEIKQCIVLEGVSPTAEILKKIESSLEEYKELFMVRLRKDYHP